MSRETIYDHPLYYDILFGWDRSHEADFYARTLEHARVRGPVLELACGTGQVALRLARRGWEVTGLDIRPSMLAFLARRAEQEGLRVETLCADMTSFSVGTPFAAAYNPMSSFRLLPSDADALAHFDRVRAALEPGGVYVLDLAFVAEPGQAAITTDEAWEMERGGITVAADDAGVRVRDGERALTLSWGDEAHLRAYTVEQFSALVAAAPGLALESWHPERSRATGVSEFSSDPSASPPRDGRAMVVVRSG
jgi:SAM-dependent methyltransferase